MTELKLDVARKILDAALAEAAELKLNPLAVTVLDVRGATKAFAAQDGTSLLRGRLPTARPMVRYRSAWDRERSSSVRRSKRSSSARSTPWQKAHWYRCPEAS